MAKISAIFWDVGGVLLTNAWDRSEREQAISTFNLDPMEFQDRHEMVVSSFERGKYVVVYAKQNGEWKAVVDSWSSDLSLHPGAETAIKPPVVAAIPPKPRR